jgi:hypothetical protein
MNMLIKGVHLMAYMNLTRFIALGTVIVTVLGACGGGAPGGQYADNTDNTSTNCGLS